MIKALRIFEITKTEDQYIEPNFEYENLTLPEEKMEDRQEGEEKIANGEENNLPTEEEQDQDQEEEEEE